VLAGRFFILVFPVQPFALRRNFLKVSDYGYYGWPNNFSVIQPLPSGAAYYGNAFQLSFVVSEPRLLAVP
jgi:hypothetical protein